jgi:hypothetical protein
MHGRNQWERAPRARGCATSGCPARAPSMAQLKHFENLGLSF